MSLMPSRPFQQPSALATGLLLLATLLASACSDPQASAPAQAAAPQGVDVTTAEVVVRPMGAEVEAVGTASANESVDVTSEVSKKVTAIRFNEGDVVRAGAILVELDSDEAKASVAEAEAALTDATSRLRRSKDLFTREALSQAELDQLESTHRASEARLEAARARLADTVIRAGFSGRTGFRRVSVGTLVGPNTVITTLDDTSVIKLNFTVPETAFSVIKKGLPVTATSVALPNRKFEGKVLDLDSRVDPITRSITVRAQIPNPDGALRPGMFMTVALQGEAVPALVVPETAIVPEQGSTYVFVVRDGVAERREVHVGRRRPGEVQLVSGVKTGEHVVIEGTQNLRDGTRVRERAAGTAGDSEPGT
jgi:membrane fusion protein, multidrug efflux system